jgi:hypothetical protein
MAARVTNGWRVYGFVTTGPTARRRVTLAASAARIQVSRHQNASGRPSQSAPADSAARARAVTSATLGLSMWVIRPTLMTTAAWT